MKKRLLALVAVLLLAVLMTAVASATPSMTVVPAAGVDTSALTEGDTFDVYIVVSPFAKAGSTKNYVYRVSEDTATGAPNASNSKITAMNFTMTWDEGSLEVANVGYFQGYPINGATTQSAGNGYMYAYLAQTPANNANAVAVPTITGVGSGANNTGTLTIDYASGISNVGATAANKGKVSGFVVRDQNAVPTGVVAKVTFRVVAGAEGGDNLPITLTNAYTFSGTNYTKTATNVTVSVEAGCAHENKTALDDAGLAAAGKQNVTATCLKEGQTWYYCSDCGENVVETSNKLEHKYDKFGYTKVPTCLSKGTSAMFCSVDPECTAHDTATEASVDALGHEFLDESHVYLAPTCTENGYELYTCTRCNGISSNKSDYIAITYIDGVFGGDGSIPEKVLLAALGHAWVLDRTVDGVSYYVCSRNCGVAENEVSLEDTVRYVSDNGTGDGKTVNTPTTLDKAFDAFTGLPAEVDCTIYLIGTVTLPYRPISANNTAVKNFEESQHDATVTITTAPGKSKATLKFPFTTVSMYYLYGPTVFDNIKIASDTPGTTSGSSASISIFARGFELTMTKNFETVSSGSGIYYSKKLGSFSLATDPMEMTIPDCKLYLIGGFYPGGSYSGANTTTYEATMNIYGGTYWVVSGGSRNDSLTIKDSVININVGDKAKIGQLIPISTATGCVATGTEVNIHYYSGFEGVLVYRAQNAKTSGLYTVNHFFHKGSGNLKVGDFMMGLKDDHGRNVNVYAYEFDASALAMGQSVYNKGVTNSTYDIYNGVGSQEFKTFTEWCVVYGGGHDYDEDDVCTFCGIEKCSRHVTENVVVSLPTCQEDGLSYDYCTVCFEHVGEDVIVPKDPDAHNFQWNLDKTPIESYCANEGCGYVRATFSGDLPNVIYVSDNGYGDGGFSADYPINDYETAFKMAASLDGDAYIYVVGSITLKPNYPGTSSHTVFLEPAHDNTITVGGYKTSAVVKFGSQGGRILYNLNGDTTFENVEFAEFSNNNVSYSYSYIIASHNHLTFGENVSSSYERHVSGSPYHNGKLVVIGGCYHGNYSLYPSDTKGCTKTDAHITFHSGNFYNVIGGSAGVGCGFTNGTIQLDFLGDIVIQDYFAAGSYQLPAGDIVLNFNDGSVACASMFSFYGYNTSSNLNSANVKDVTINIYGGTLSSNNFQATQSSAALRPIGASFYPDDATNNVYDTTAHMDSFTICYDPANGSAKDMYHTILACVLGGSKTVSVKTIGDTFCEASANGDHVKGEVVEEVESTCAKQGYGVYVCTECSKEYTVPGEVVDHNFGGVEIASAANCINPEIAKEVCVDCGFIQYSIGNAAATGEHTYDENNVCVYCTQSRQDLCVHVWDDGVEVTTGCGVGLEYTCTEGCGKTKVEITSTAHNYGKYTVTVEPTATEPGVKTRTCKSCGKVETALIYADGSAANGQAIAVDASGNLADVEIATSKLSKAEKAVIDSLIQDAAYGSEVKVSYNVDGSVANVTYSIPLPAEYADMQNLQVIVKDDDGQLHVVTFQIEKGYIVFTF